MRDAVLADLPAIQAIYAHHVCHGLATFEEVPPSTEEMQGRWQNLCSQGLPYLVVTADAVVLGYAYAALFRPRSAYRFTLEDSIYVAADQAGRGLGAALLAELIRRCEAGPWRQLIAVIGDSANAASIALHQRFGFEPAGVQRAVGLKFGRWVDTVTMQRPLGEGAGPPPGSAPKGL